MSSSQEAHVNQGYHWTRQLRRGYRKLGHWGRLRRGPRQSAPPTDRRHQTSWAGRYTILPPDRVTHISVGYQSDQRTWPSLRSAPERLYHHGTPQKTKNE